MACLQEALHAAAGVLGALPVVAVRQQHHEAALAQPLGLAAAHELVEDDLPGDGGWGWGGIRGGSKAPAGRLLHGLQGRLNKSENFACSGHQGYLLHESLARICAAGRQHGSGACAAEGRMRRASLGRLACAPLAKSPNCASQMTRALGFSIE